MDKPAGIRASWRRLLYRYVAGALVGNTWALSRADYSDLKSGEPIGTRTYDTSPSAWEGYCLGHDAETGAGDCQADDQRYQENQGQVNRHRGENACSHSGS